MIFVLACFGCLAVVVFSEDVEGQAYILPTLLNGNNFGQQITKDTTEGSYCASFQVV